MVSLIRKTILPRGSMQENMGSHFPRIVLVYILNIQSLFNQHERDQKV
jgi:hypothetical protein